MVAPVLPPVSDHAVLRYLERSCGIPVETIRHQLAQSAAIGISHDAAVIVLGRVKLVVRDGVVTTCLMRSWKAGSKQPKRRHRHDPDA